MEPDVKGRPSAEDNLGLVHRCANKFRGRGIEYEDLYSAGCIGLLKAVRAFDSCRGVKFSTYAVPVILGEIKRLFRDGGTVRVSRSLKELSLKIQRLCTEFRQLNGREPTVSELALLSGADEADVSEALCVSQPVLSLTSGGEDEGQIDIPSEAPDGEIVDILPNYNVRVNDRCGYTVMVRHIDSRGNIHIFHSSNQKSYIDKSVIGKSVKVYYENDSFENYYLDLEGVLPAVIEH